MASTGSPEPIDRESCRETFAGNEYNPKLADLLETSHKRCGCEACSVGLNSPGPVGDEEELHRIVVSPRDVDENGFIVAAPFEKVFTNGLSVARSCATCEEVEKMVSDGLWTKQGFPRASVRLVMSARVARIRAEEADGERLFCVYHQTVPRRFDKDEEVAAHAGIFLRFPPAGTPDRKRIQKDFARDLRDIFVRGVTNPDDFLNGFLRELSERAALGQFVLPEQP